MATETSAENAEGAEKAEEKAEEKKPVTIYYVTDELQQAQYIKMFKDAGLTAMVCDNSYIDPHFITFLEYKAPDKVKFARIDAAVDGALREGDGATDSVIEEIFKSALADDKLTIKTDRLKNTAVPAIINVDETMRRYSEMGRMYGMSEDDPAKTLVINLANPVVAKIKDMDEEKQKFAANQIYLLALLSFKKLSNEEQNKLIENDLKMLGSLAE